MDRHVHAHVLHGHEPLHPLHDHAHEHHNVNVVFHLDERYNFRTHGYAG